MPCRGEPDPFAPRPEGEPPDDDPFAPEAPPIGETRALAHAPEPAPAHAGPIVDRDPYASPEETSEYGDAGTASFDDVLRRARRQGFLAGCLAGGAAVAAFGVVTWVLVGTTDVPTRVVRVEVVPPVQASAGAGEVASTSPGERPPVVPPAAAPGGGPATSSASPPARASPTRERWRDAPPTVAGAAGVTGPASAGEPAPAGAPAEPAASLPATAPADAAAAEPPAEPRRPGEREVMAALRARGEAIDECVALAPGHEADARGRRFQLLVVIEPGGEVSDAKVLDPDIEATPLGACLVELARELSFSRFEGEPARVELPVRYGRSR